MTSKVRHVDIISNDPLAGTERRIARVWMNGGPELEIDVDSGEASEIAYIWGFLQSKVHIDPKRNPIAFLNALPQAIDATYVFASQVHEDDTCPFLTEPRLPAPSAP